jgi:hypothetical protein
MEYKDIPLRAVYMGGVALIVVCVAAAAFVLWQRPHPPAVAEAVIYRDWPAVHVAGIVETVTGSVLTVQVTQIDGTSRTVTVTLDEHTTVDRIVGAESDTSVVVREPASVADIVPGVAVMVTSDTQADAPAIRATHIGIIE